MGTHKPDTLSAILSGMGMDRADLAALLRDLGDPGTPQAIARRLHRWDTGEARLPGEAVALLTLLGRVREAVGKLGNVANGPPV